MLDKMPVLRHMYSEDDSNMQMLYFKDAVVTINTFGKDKETFKI